jgi:hypothetical protein
MRRYIAGYIFIVLFAFLCVPFSQAASLYFSPSSVSKSAGQTFSATVRVNTESQSINAAQGSLVFDPAKVEVTSVSKTGSIFNLWTQDPTYSNSDGTISFEGGVPNPGYSGSSGLVVTISFKTKTGAGASGATSVSLVSGAILANDGQGTNILSSLGKLSLSIAGPTAPQPEATTPPDTSAPTPTVNTGDAPKVTSSTHPDSKKWYTNNNPSFVWDVPSDATGVSFLITDKATSNPGPKSDGLQDKANFTAIADGIQYFHLKFKQNAAWGTIAHYQFNIDTVAPQAFDVKTVTTDPIHPAITFTTADILSGIDHYEVKIGDGDWVSVPAEDAGKPHPISFKQVGTQTVLVKAIDKAGNATTESATVTISGSAIGSTIGDWVAKTFNGIINVLSNYSLWLVLAAAIIAIIIWLFQFMSEGLDKAWHRVNNRRVVRKTERKVDTTFGRIIDDMKKELDFLDTISKRRPLGPEEKYLKSKLQLYIKGLKNSGR